MRTIKFRAQDFTGTWNYGFIVKGNESAVILPVFKDGRVAMGINIYVTIETIGQFTGLTDKNGKEIYEGDVIEQHAEGLPDILGEVVYDEGNARFGMAYTSYLDSDSVTHFDTLEHVKCYSDGNRKLSYEVIGNIHDNPELKLDKDINIFKSEA